VTTDAPGTLAIDGGLVDTTGIQSYGERAVLGQDTELKGLVVTLVGADSSTAGGQSLRINGAAAINGNLGAQAALKSLTIDGVANVDASLIETTGAQTYLGQVILRKSLQAKTANAAVSFGDTVSSLGPVANGLDVRNGTGDVSFANQVGDDGAGRLGALQLGGTGNQTLRGAVYAASVTSEGTAILDGGLVDTTGDQNYNGKYTVLSRDTVLRGTKVTLGGRTYAATPGGASLRIEGDADIRGGLGYRTNGQGQILALSSLTITGDAALSGDATVSGNVINTTGAQTYQGKVTLGSDMELWTTNGPVSFEDTLLSAAGVGGGLSVYAGSGAITLAKQVGNAGTGRLGGLTLDSSGAATLGDTVYASFVVSSGGGTLALNSGLVDTTGTQNYGNHVVLGKHTTLDGTVVVLSGGVDAKTAGVETLMITGAGNLVSAIGQTAALGALTVTNGAVFNGSPITTTGAQRYQGTSYATVADTTLTTSNSAVTFEGTLLGNGAIKRGLTINAGSGNVSFAKIGNDSALLNLGSMIVNSSGATTFNDKVYAASVTTDAPGTLAIDGGLIQTTLSQSYGERAVLGADTTLTGDSVTLSQGADAAAAGGQS
ncbi:beta strand repeat-containing protein, partial [Bordetella genomosp. 13]|uniref:beta strand repeat-containing protein n=1 Tax=Bordetella genomosp. 13 TaxID=463040 RepID=UPI001C92D577